MAIETKIEWADATWNPFIGCSKVSPACDNCYAERWAVRTGRDFKSVKRSASPTFHGPLHWKTPKKIFVCSLSDFFHEEIMRADRHAAIKIMRDASQHTYMILTKRPQNIAPMLAGTTWAEKVPDNVWLGVTAENQEQYDKRAPELFKAPARVKFLSCEPLLGDIKIDTNNLDWVICGGESGPHARPMNPTWARDLRDQCAARNTPFMFKQWGEWRGEIKMGKKLAGKLLDGVEHNRAPL
jgi:protein gp37